VRVLAEAQHMMVNNAIREHMMMIAFTTINSGLVPLIEGLCAQNYYCTFEIINSLCIHLLLFFFERENMLKEKCSWSEILS